MNSIIHAAEDSSRFTLALLLALALHVVLILVIPAAHWSLPKLTPLRFEAILLPPVASPPIIGPQHPASVQPTETPSHSPMPLPATLPSQTSIPPDTTEPTSTAPPALKPPLTLKSASLMAAKPKTTPQQQAVVTASRNLRSALDQPKPSIPKPTPKKPVIATPSTPSAAVSTRTVTRPTGRAAAADVATTSRPKSATSLARSSPRLSSSAETAAITSSGKPTSAGFESPGLAREAVRAEDFPAIKNSPNKISSTNRSSRGRVDSSALLGQVASLEAETQRRATAGIRSKRVNPSDMQSLEGFYIAAWVRKVERIGEMNFPEAARQDNLSRGPILDVAIRADGSIQAIRIVRSSGNSELDQAAQRIVRLGAPYATFSPELRQKYDVLSISRPWRFEPSGQVRMR